MTEITIAVPIGEYNSSIPTQAVQLDSGTALQGAKALTGGLVAQKATLVSGKEVSSISDALVWVCEQIGRGNKAHASKSRKTPGSD